MLVALYVSPCCHLCFAFLAMGECLIQSCVVLRTADLASFLWAQRESKRLWRDAVGPRVGRDLVCPVRICRQCLVRHLPVFLVHQCRDIIKMSRDICLQNAPKYPSRRQIFTHAPFHTVHSRPPGPVGDARSVRRTPRIPFPSLLPGKFHSVRTDSYGSQGTFSPLLTQWK